VQSVLHRDHVTLRRHNLFPYILCPSFLLALGLVAVLNQPLTTGVAAALAAAGLSMVILCYLDGPAAYVRVTGTLVVVVNVFGIHRVPREMVDRVGGYENLGVDLYLRDGKKVPISAFEPSLNPWGRSRSTYVRLGRRLDRALGQVSAEGMGGAAYRWRPRYTSIIIASIAIIVLVIAYFWAPSNA
jgi:hypothetical protein